MSYLTLSYHSSTSHQTSANLYNEAVITGAGIAQSLMEEIQGKAFDENTISDVLYSADSLTFSLGPEAGETSPASFDDIDDYNNYTMTETHGRLGDFDAVVRISYINSMSPESKSFGQTFSKRVDIFVTTFVLKDTLKFNHVRSY